jgi:hypothetical protein
VRASVGEYIVNLEHNSQFSNWISLSVCRFDGSLLGNHRARRRLTLASWRRRRHRVTSRVLILPGWMNRRVIHMKLSRIYFIRQLSPSVDIMSYFLFLLMLCCGDVERNPGPRPLHRAPSPHSALFCLFCDKVGRKNQRKLICDLCGNKYHSKCLGLSQTDIIKKYNSVKWTSWSCCAQIF